MSIFSICLDLWVRYNSQFCWYEWRNVSGPLVPNWKLRITENTKISIFVRAKVSRCTICFRPQKCFVENCGLGFTWSKHTCFCSECKFYKMAQNEYDTRKMNMIRECNRVELDTCLVQLDWDLCCRRTFFDFHPCLALTYICRWWWYQLNLLGKQLWQTLLKKEAKHDML